MDTEVQHSRQVAPFPEILASLVSRVKYRGGWKFTLGNIDRGQGSVGLTLTIQILCKDTYHPEHLIRINHYMPVPPAAYDERSWRRWLFEQVLLVERHEACEFFQVDGVRPYAPNHGPGNDPYMVIEVGTDEEKRTSYLGEVRDTHDPEGAA